MKLAKDPITEYEQGLPCMFGEVVGRIVGEDDKGSWGEINGVEMFSIPLFSSPHGTIVSTGVFYLSKMTEEGMKKLLDYEKDAIAEKIELYAGKFTPETIKCKKSK